MSLLHKAMAETLRPSVGAGKTNFEKRCEDNVGENYYSFVMSYGLEIRRSKDLFCVKCGVAVKQSPIRLWPRMKDIWNLLVCGGRVIK